MTWLDRIMARMQAADKEAETERRRLHAAIKADPTGALQRRHCDELRAEQRLAREAHADRLIVSLSASLMALREAHWAAIGDIFLEHSGREALPLLSMQASDAQDPAEWKVHRLAEEVIRRRRQMVAERARCDEEIGRLGETYPWTDPGRLHELETPWFTGIPDMQFHADIGYASEQLKPETPRHEFVDTCGLDLAWAMFGDHALAPETVALLEQLPDVTDDPVAAMTSLGPPVWHEIETIGQRALQGSAEHPEPTTDSRVAQVGSAFPGLAVKPAGDRVWLELRKY